MAVGSVLSGHDALDAKTREVVCTAIDCCKTLLSRPGWNKHARNAIGVGADGGGGCGGFWSWRRGIGVESGVIGVGVAAGGDGEEGRRDKGGASAKSGDIAAVVEMMRDGRSLSPSSFPFSIVRRSSLASIDPSR